MGGNQGLHQLLPDPGLIPAVAVLRHGMQGQAGFILDRGNLIGRRPDEQHVVHVQCALPRVSIAGAALPQPFDHLEAVLKLALELLQGLADPRGVGLDDQFDVVLIQPKVVRLGSGGAAPGQQPSPQQHVDEPQQDKRRTDRRDREETQAGATLALQQVAGQQEGRRADHGERRAEGRRQRHGHQHPGGWQALLPGDPHEDRQHHRGDHQVMGERRQCGHRGHDDGDRAPLAAARHTPDQGADTLGKAGGGQPAGEHENRGHDDRRFTAETGECFVGRENSREGQRGENEHGSHVDAEFLRDEQDEARAKNEQEGDLL